MKKRNPKMTEKDNHLQEVSIFEKTGKYSPLTLTVRITQFERGFSNTIAYHHVYFLKNNHVWYWDLTKYNFFFNAEMKTRLY